jgi:GNAT superfamily N-acetyltransferase
MKENFPEFQSENIPIEKQKLEEKYSYYLDQLGKFWVMEEEKAIVGLVGVQVQSDGRAELIQLRVKRSYRKRGIGTLLIGKAENYVRSQGKSTLYLHTAKRLKRARNLYEKVGYTLENTIDSSGMTVMTYKKNLFE